MHKKVVLIFAFFIVLAASNFVFAVAKQKAFSKPSADFQTTLSLYGGLSTLDSEETHIKVTDTEKDKIKSKTVAGPILGLGIWYNLADYQAQSVSNPPKNQIALGINLFDLFHSLEGKVYQYGVPILANYRYRLEINSLPLMLNAKFSRQLLSDRLRLFGIIGVGTAWHLLSYQDKHISGVPDIRDIHLSSRSYATVAYDLGLGLAYNFNQRASVSLEYLYINLGRVKTSMINHGAAVLDPVTFKLQSHNVLLGLNWNV